MASRKRSKQAEEILADPFLDHGERISAWFEKNFKLLFGGVVLVLVGVIGFEVIQGQQARSASLVTDDFMGALEAYEEATDPTTVLTATTAEVLHLGFERADRKFSDFISENANHGSVRLAKLYQADLQRRLGRLGEAEGGYRGYADGAPPNDPALVFALEGLGYLQEDQGNLDAALETYKRLERDQAFYKDHALRHQARILEAKKDTAGAIAAYKSIIEMKPESNLKAEAEARLKALE